MKIVGLGYARVYAGDELVPGFRVLGFHGDDVDVYGARTPTKAPAVRTFPIDRIGGRPRRRAVADA